MTHPLVWQTAAWLAANTPDNSTDNGGGESKKSGPLGLVVIIVLCVGCYFLFKSMSKHMKRVREDFPVGTSGAPVESLASEVSPGDDPKPAQAPSPAAEDDGPAP